MSRYGRFIKGFETGGNEYRVYELGGIYSLYYWEEVNYDEYEPVEIDRADNMDEIQQAIEMLLEYNVDYDMNL